jgi:hypothetical protein|tara:strand:- start:877 stop:1458 length:582 start_codon:yes stop_codon:yes gene_type:complete
MTFNIDNTLTIKETSGVSYMEPGLHDDCEMTGVTKKVASNGRSYLEFTFINSTNEVLTHAEWDTDPERVTARPGESNDEAVARKVKNMLMRIKHIGTKFIPEDQFVIKAQSFDDLCSAVVTALTGKGTGKKVRLKVVYNYNDYSSLPNYCPFIESMSTTPSGLKINKNYDKMEKTSEAVAAEAGGTDESQLPF